MRRWPSCGKQQPSLRSQSSGPRTRSLLAIPALLARLDAAEARADRFEKELAHEREAALRLTREKRELAQESVSAIANLRVDLDAALASSPEGVVTLDGKQWKLEEEWVDHGPSVELMYRRVEIGP